MGVPRVICYKHNSWDCVDCSTQPDPTNPSHYRAHPSGIECIQITEHLNFCLGNAIKYIWRADLKGGVEDLEKAVWYLTREIGRRQRDLHGKPSSPSGETAS